MENSIMGLDQPPPPPGYGKKNYLFSETRPFLRTFCKKSIFTIENPKKNIEIFSKNDKTTFRQANFCLLRFQILPQHAKFCLRHVQF